MMMRSNLDFYLVFLGCQAAGIVPVPLYPPVSLKRSESLDFAGSVGFGTKVAEPEP